MRMLFALLAVAAGVAVPFQSAANQGLMNRTGIGPALLVNTSLVLMCVAGLWLATGARTTFFPAGTAWTLYLGGILGFIIIAAAAFVFPKLGAAWAVALMVFGQCVAALVIDHWGLLGMEKSLVTPQRLIGVALVACGVAVCRL